MREMKKNVMIFLFEWKVKNSFCQIVCLFFFSSYFIYAVDLTCVVSNDDSLFSFVISVHLQIVNLSHGEVWIDKYAKEKLCKYLILLWLLHLICTRALNPSRLTITMSSSVHLQIIIQAVD